MPPLRRHQLAHLSSPAWQELLDDDWDLEARACIEHWASCALPLVVTRQCAPRRHLDAPVSLGLAAPACWGRRALSLQVKPSGILYFSEFPGLSEVLGQLPAGVRPPLQKLEAELIQHGLRSHVYGSLGWQTLSDLAYLHRRSDIDLWLAVEGAEQADAARRALQRCQATLRVDGELMFPDGGAVAWREWAAWREGCCTHVLVKRLHGASLDDLSRMLPLGWPYAA